MCLQGPTDLKNDAYLELGVIFVVQNFFFFLIGIGMVILHSLIRSRMWSVFLIQVCTLHSGHTFPLELPEMHWAVALTERKKAGKRTNNCLKVTFMSLKVFFSPGIKIGSDVHELFSCGWEGFYSITTLISKYLFVPLILIEQIVCLPV